MLFDLIMRNRVKGDKCIVTLGRHGFLIYDEGDASYHVAVSEGGGYGIVVEEMANYDAKLRAKTSEDWLRIALNIKQTLALRGIVVDVIHKHSIVGS
jgi:hypothetical protein